jgi:hypothetical protein
MRKEFESRMHHNDPFREYLWQLSMDSSYCDDVAGNVDECGYWACRIGRNIVWTDSMGNLYREKLSKDSIYNGCSLDVWFEDTFMIPASIYELENEDE